MDGPAGDGPTFVEWARSVAACGEHRVPWAVDEAREVRPDSFPSRRLQGVCYADQLARVSELGGVTVTHLLGTAVNVAPAALPGEPDLRAVRLADGSTLLARTVVLVQGLGANFFDVVAELTAGRGGVFETVHGDTRGRLRSHASGTEPEIHAVSRRGIPYRSKGDYGDTGSPAYRAEIATAAWFAAVRDARPHSLDFAAEVWPVLAAELGYAWLRALAACTPASLAASLDDARERLTRAAQHDVTSAGERRVPFAVPHIDAALTQLVPDPAHQLVVDELDSLAHPLASPRQAVNRAMGALRGPAARLATLGLVAPDSVVRDVHGWFNADGLFLASGPPASRVREVLALIEAGVVRLVGPDTSVSIDPGSGVFRAESAVTGAVVTARSLVDAAGSPDPRVLVLGIPASSTQPGSAIGAAPGVPSPLLAGADRAAAELLARLEEQPQRPLRQATAVSA